MDIYFIRHGIAVDPTATDDDRDRWLTKQGIKKVRQVASSLRGLDLEFDIIISSPLVRAEQTAEILINQGLSEVLGIQPDLAPGGNLEQWVQWLKDYQAQHPQAQSMAVVGHEPGLSTWTEMLLFNQVFQRLQLKKAGIIAVHWPVTISPLGNCQLLWLIPPKIWL
jgi:phosphohistidine phosphatase